jgi:DNA-binding CsgD family transcriptional regulator
VPHAYTVFGEELVLACTEWGVVTDDLVAIRSPLLVQALIAIFDAAWRVGLPVPHSSRDAGLDDRLLAMLAAGLKDEAIARNLRISLRTVRRRVAALMESVGAQTRFQLGSAAERRGLLTADQT